MDIDKHKSKIGRTVYFDVLNILATMCVVWIHFGNEIHWYDGSQVWYWCLPIQVICYWAVPVFLMLTGATLMDYRKKYSTGVFFMRRMNRTLIPYLFWGTVMIVVQIYRGRMELIYDGEMLKFELSILDIFLHYKMEPIYWFFPMIFGVYLSMPVLSLLSEEKNREVLDYTVIVGILTVSVLPFALAMAKEYLGYPIMGFTNSLKLPVVGGYLIYPVMGYWASKRNFSTKERIMLYVMAILCGILRYIGIEELSVRDGVTNQLYMDYLSFPALFLALGVFVFVRYFCERYNGFFQKISVVLAKVSLCSLGVYLIHNLVLEKMGTMAFFEKYSFAWYFLWPGACYLFCLLVVYLCKKIPLIQKVFP